MCSLYKTSQVITAPVRFVVVPKFRALILENVWITFYVVLTEILFVRHCEAFFAEAILKI